MNIAGTTISVGWVIGLVVMILSIVLLFMKLVGIFPMEAPDTILFVFTALLGLARIC